MTKTYGNDTFGALSDKCLSKIKVSNAKRQDGLQLNLELVRSKVYLHNGFYLRYTSSYCIAKNLKRNPLTQKCASAEESVAKRRRSALLPFSFTESCLFCGEMCSLRPDPRNPSRWRKYILCRTADRGKGNKSFMGIILQVCASLSMMRLYQLCDVSRWRTCFTYECVVVNF